MPRTKTKSLAKIFFNFVRDNPQVAASIAFQLGIWAGETMPSARRLKRSAHIPKNLLDVLPASVSTAALKLLPGPALQPSQPSTKSRRGRKRRPRKAAS